VAALIVSPLRTFAMPTILIREISAYLGPNLLLGVFASAQEAEQQRAAYFADRTERPASDPWREQPHKPDGLQMSDLVISDIQGSRISCGTVVYVISSYSEGFGQTVRSFISVHNDKAVALRQAARLEEADTDSFPNHYRIQEAIVGQLLPDDPDLQSGWYE
jgi:hypothetical protein